MIYIVNDGDFCHIVKSEQMSTYQYAEVLLEGHSTFTETSLVNRYVNVCKQRFKICVSYMAANSANNIFTIQFSNSINSIAGKLGS